MRPQTRPLTACFLLLAASCGEPTTPPAVEPGIRVVSTVPADTVRALLPPLEVEVNDADGHPVGGVEVRFTPVARPVDRPSWHSGPDVRLHVRAEDGVHHGAAPISLTTDARGRARVQVRLGIHAGTGELALDVPALGYADTARFEIRPGGVFRILAEPRDSALFAGSGYPLRLRAEDVWENVRPEVPTVTVASGPVTLDGARVRGTAVGRATLVARLGALADTAHVSVVPRGTLAARDLRLTEPEYSEGWTVSRFELDGSGFTPILRDPASTIDRLPGLAWAPDGGHLLVTAGSPRTEIHRVGLDGALTRLFAPPGIAFDLAGTYARGMEWVYFSRASRGQAQEIDVFRSRPDGSGVQRLTPEPTEWFKEDRDPDASPDGTRVAYVSNRDRSYAEGRLGDGYLRVLDLAGGHLLRLNLAAARPRWSPAGDWIAFVGESSRLYLVRPDGSGLRVLDPEPYWPGVTWSPDGRWVVAARVQGPLVLVSVDGAHRLPLGYATGLLDPAWRPE